MLLHCVNLGADGKICVVGLHRKRCTPTTPVLTRALRSTVTWGYELHHARASYDGDSTTRVPPLPRQAAAPESSHLYLSQPLAHGVLLHQVTVVALNHHQRRSGVSQLPAWSARP